MLVVSSSPSPLACSTSPQPALPPPNTTSSSSKRLKRIKSVTFMDGSKKHDGLTERKQVYEYVVQQFFFYQVEVSELFVLEVTLHDVKRCVELFGDFQDLALRMKHEIIEQGKEFVPVLPRGGGAALRLFQDHFSYVLLLCRVIEAALNRLLNGLPSPVSSAHCVDLETGDLFLPVAAAASPSSLKERGEG